MRKFIDHQKLMVIQDFFTRSKVIFRKYDNWDLVEIRYYVSCICYFI